MIIQCLVVVAVAAVALSVPVTQEEYARYIAQQQTQRLEDRPSDKGQAVRRPLLVVPAGSSAAYPQPSGARSAYRQQPAAAAHPQPAYQPAPAAYQPALAAYQPAPAAYQPAPAAYQPQPAYAPQPSYQQSQAYQQPDEYQPEQQQYQPAAARAPAPRPKGPPRPKASNKPEDEENDNNPNAQYQFSFDISDDESTNYHNRKEQRDGEKISGSYSVVDSDGFIRTVTYTADPEEGFKAEVSREPTNIQVKIPTPAPQPAAPAPQYRLPERKAQPQPQYIAIQASEPESAAQPIEPISGYYRAVPQQAKAPAAHRFAAPRPQPAGKANALGYAITPTNSPIIYQAYQQ